MTDTTDVTDVMDGGEGGWRLSRRAGAILAVTLGFFIVASPVVIVGLRPAHHWVIVRVVERMGLEGLGVDPQEGQIFPGGLLGATEKSEADVQLGTRLRFALDHDTRITLPRAPGRWFRRGATVRFEKGVLRGLNGTGSGAPVALVFDTAAGRAHIVSGVFEIASGDGFTSFALEKGEMRLLAPGQKAELVMHAGEETRFFADGRAAVTAPIPEDERAQLRAMAAAGMTSFEGAR